MTFLEQRKCNLYTMPACSISNCVQNITGLQGAMMSPSDTWILHLKKDSAKYQHEEQSITIDNVFLKWSVSEEDWFSSYEKVYRALAEQGRIRPEIFGEAWRSIKNYNKRKIYEEQENKLLALSYEVDIYRYIIKPILDNSISPHFVRYFQSSKNCRIGDLYAILQNSIRFKDELASRRLLRNLTHIFFGYNKRGNINDENITKEDELSYLQGPLIYEAVPNLKITFLLLQYMDTSTSETLAKFLFKGRDLLLSQLEKDAAIKPEIKKIFTIIMFQITQACYTLVLKNTFHNDLHLNNIFITSRPHKTNVKYIIKDDAGNPLEMTFHHINYCARLFDFDQATSGNLSWENPVVEVPAMKDGKLQYPMRDIAQIMCAVTYVLKDNFLLWTLIDKNTELANDFISIAMKESHCAFPRLSETTYNKLAAIMYSYPQVLKNLYDLYIFYGGSPSNDVIETFSAL